MQMQQQQHASAPRARSPAAVVAIAGRKGPGRSRASSAAKGIRKELDKIVRNMRTATKKFEAVHKANIEKLDRIAREDIEFARTAFDYDADVEGAAGEKAGGSGSDSDPEDWFKPVPIHGFMPPDELNT